MFSDDVNMYYHQSINGSPVAFGLYDFMFLKGKFTKKTERVKFVKFRFIFTNFKMHVSVVSSLRPHIGFTFIFP